MIDHQNTNASDASNVNVMNFILLDRVEQVKHIIHLTNTSRDAELITTLITQYEFDNGAGAFEFDRQRQVYSFLKGVDMYQIVNLYDAMTSTAKDILIEVIKVDHVHLINIVNIHSHVALINAPVNSLSIN